MASLTVVCDLKPFKSMWKIRVKIIRLWRQYSAAGGLTIEMVLIDSNVIIFTLCFLFLANITSDQIFLKLNNINIFINLLFFNSKIVYHF